MIVAQRCLNHSLGGLVGVADQPYYMTERRAALETWASFVLACGPASPGTEQRDPDSGRCMTPAT